MSFQGGRGFQKSRKDDRRWPLAIPRRRQPGHAPPHPRPFGQCAAMSRSLPTALRDRVLKPASAGTDVPTNQNRQARPRKFALGLHNLDPREVKIQATCFPS